MAFSLSMLIGDWLSPEQALFNSLYQFSGPEERNSFYCMEESIIQIEKVYA